MDMESTSQIKPDLLNAEDAKLQCTIPDDEVSERDDMIGGLPGETDDNSRIEDSHQVVTGKVHISPQ